MKQKVKRQLTRNNKNQLWDEDYRREKQIYSPNNGGENMQNIKSSLEAASFGESNIFKTLTVLHYDPFLSHL